MTLNRQRLPLLFEHRTRSMFCGADLQNAILEEASPMPVQQVKAIFQHGRYPAISIGGRKIHIHRLLAKYYIRRRLRKNEIVHHINGNDWDARQYNLLVTQQGAHARGHLTGRKQSPELVKRRIAASVRKRWPNSIYENPELVEELL